MAKEGTKICKYCKSEIPADAKICPNCRKKQGGIAKWIIIGVVVLIIIVAAAGSGDDKDSSKKSADSSSSTSVESTTKSEEKTVEYEAITVEQLMNDLDANAMSASDTYKGNYYAVTGKLSNIDAQGSYIDIVDPNDEWAILGVQCYIKSDEVRDVVKTLSKDSTITVKGKITDVGEVMGYSLNIDSIEQ